MNDPFLIGIPGLSQESQDSRQFCGISIEVAGFPSNLRDFNRKMWIDDDFFPELVFNLRFPAKAIRTCPDFQENRARLKDTGDVLKFSSKTGNRRRNEIQNEKHPEGSEHRL